MKTYFWKQNSFTILTKFLVIILPFYVLIKVFFEHKLGIPKFGFLIKEFVLILLIVSLVYEYYKQKLLPKLDLIDILILSYFGYGILITLFNGLWLANLFYGWRYDFIFFVTFLIYKHWKPYLNIPTKTLILYFVSSWALALFLSIIIKFRIGEEMLLLFGYTDYVSQWTYNGSIPIYHGLENSGIKRFSGIFDSPNTMAFFLIMFSSFYLFFQKNKQEFYVYLSMWVLGVLVFLTYSRSAILGIVLATWILFLSNIKYLYKHYKKALIALIITWTLTTWIWWFILQDNVKNIVLRTSSTKGHFDRMEIGIDRFLEKPFGSGLWESWPTYRNTHTDLENTKEIEEYYIPESWFIQQLVEGWFIYFLLFMSILWLIGKKLFQTSKVLFSMFLAILVMNVFLHTFEATYLSILLFLFLGLFYKKSENI